MRNLKNIAACIGVALVAGSALADDFVPTEWFDIGEGFLTGGAFFSTDIEVMGDPDMGVVGFEVRFDYNHDSTDDSWASDAQVLVIGPVGDMWSVGGLDNLHLSDDAWSFQGSGSAAPGHYGDSGEDIFLPWVAEPLDVGTFHVVFANDWMNDPMANEYDADIRFYQQVPAPGAIALLGAAGLVGARRRRR